MPRSRRESPQPNMNGMKLPELLRTSFPSFFGAPVHEEQKEAEPLHLEPIIVYVYNLGTTFVTRGLNHITKSYGAFHTGVVVYGREWSFGMTLDDESSGLTWNYPGRNFDHSFREALPMGCTKLSRLAVLNVLREMESEWKGNSYQVLTRNCHHFTEDFCRRLGVNTPPPWINKLAGTGAATVEFLDSADSGYDGGEALFDIANSVMLQMQQPSRFWNSLDLRNLNPFTDFGAEEESRREPPTRPARYEEKAWRRPREQPNPDEGDSNFLSSLFSVR
eukprot:NODE_10534_length_1345_cov_4.799672.p1 GENE.NODE_10534_length_1345_cov_4.799672~~NODE_10534_length_1345_cov_4.799672.p1  ORF type:complete len:277 (-),score=84.33 NODE_10534_length_1345_cov_4.799672:359-1189(-)